MASDVVDGSSAQVLQVVSAGLTVGVPAYLGPGGAKFDVDVSATNPKRVLVSAHIQFFPRHRASTAMLRQI